MSSNARHHHPINHDAHDYAEGIRRKSITCISSPFTKPNPPPVLPLLTRVLCLGLLHLRNLPLQYRLLHRVRFRAPRMDRIHTLCLS